LIDIIDRSVILTDVFTQATAIERVDYIRVATLITLITFNFNYFNHFQLLFLAANKIIPG